MSISNADVEAVLLLSSRVSGSIGDRTFSRNAQGPYVKDRPNPVNPDTLLQRTTRRRFRRLTRLWAGVLTDTHRIGWNVYARNVPIRNRIAHERYLTGFQHFVRSNVTRLAAIGTYLFNPPTIFNLGEYLPFRLAAAFGDPWMQIDWDTPQNWTGEAGTFAWLSLTSSYSPSVRSFRPPYRFWAILPSPSPPPILRNLPIPTIQGNRVFARIEVSRQDGRLSYAQRTSFLIT